MGWLMGEKDLEKRTFDFAVSVIKFLKEIKYSKENDVVKYQFDLPPKKWTQRRENGRIAINS